MRLPAEELQPVEKRPKLPGYKKHLTGAPLALGSPTGISGSQGTCIVFAMSTIGLILSRHGKALLTQYHGPVRCLSSRSSVWDSMGIWLDEPVHLPPVPLGRVSVLDVGFATHTGKRRANEDRLTVSKLGEDAFLFAVFDGHGGDAAADFCSRNLSSLIQMNLLQDPDLESVLEKSFLQTDKYFLHNSNCEKDASGTTATVALVRNETELVIGSVGDSCAVLCRKGKAERLTEDHSPRRKDERDRIQKCGGYIEWNSAGDPYVNGKLAMTRSIGDFHMKSSGVIALPEISSVKVEHDTDGFLLLTTDGVSGTMEAQEMCDIVKKSQDPSEAAHIINDQALQYGTQDNVTTLVIPFGAWGKYKRALKSSSFGRMMVASCRWS